MYINEFLQSLCLNRQECQSTHAHPSPEKESSSAAMSDKECFFFFLKESPFLLNQLMPARLRENKTACSEPWWLGYQRQACNRGSKACRKDRTHEVAYKLKFSLRVGSVGGGAGRSSGWVSMKVQKTVNKQVRCCSSNFPGEKNHVWLVLRIFGSRHVNQVQ